MPFVVVSGVGQWMVYKMEVEIVKGEEADLGLNVGHPIVTNEDSVA